MKDAPQSLATAQRGDGLHFESVYESELTPLVRLATMLLGSQALGEEAVQDAFLRLHRDWASVRSPGGFVRTATINRCRDIQRREARAVRYLRAEPPHAAPEHHYLIDALQKLSPTRRTVLVLRFYGNHKLREISELLDIPEGTVRSNLSRGLDDLREVLK